MHVRQTALAMTEDCARAPRLQVLCTTSTLAMGVNLPAHLVVIKGTQRYVGPGESQGCSVPGEGGGYQEYSQTEAGAGVTLH
jgi:replicative superfamily II helicase